MYREPDSSLRCPLAGQEAMDTNLKNIKICLNTRKTFFGMMLVKHRNGFLREIVDFYFCGDIQNLTVLGGQL